jgi:hypothetical protein
MRPLGLMIQIEVTLLLLSLTPVEPSATIITSFIEQPTLATIINYNSNMVQAAKVDCKYLF